MSTMPIPPAHWDRLRQRSREGATSSGTWMVEAPVVVKPAMDSKKASTGPMVPARTNGTAPVVATPNHPRTTMRNTSCLKMRGSRLLVRKKRLAPSAIATTAGSPKANTLPSSARSEKAAGMSIAAPPAATTAPSALAITLGCKEALYLFNRVLDGEDDRVVPWPEHLPAGGDDDVPVTQERSYDGAIGEAHLGERAAGDGGPFGDPKLYHLGAALQKCHLNDLPLPHEPEYRLGGQHPGRDRQVHPEGVGERRELSPAYARDGHPGSELASVHRGEEVGPVVAGDGDEGVRLVYPLLEQEVPGDALVVEDEPSLELRCHVTRACLVPLDHPHRHAGSLQGEGESQPDAPAPVDRHVPDRRRVGSDGLDRLGDAPPAGDEQDVVPVLQHGVPARHERISAPHHPDHQAPLRKVHVLERTAHRW